MLGYAIELAERFNLLERLEELKIKQERSRNKTLESLIPGFIRKN